MDTDKIDQAWRDLVAWRPRGHSYTYLRRIATEHDATAGCDIVEITPAEPDHIEMKNYSCRSDGYTAR